MRNNTYINSEHEKIYSQAELYHFYHKLSHDLKAPVRGVNNLACFLQEDYAHLLDEQGQEYLVRLQDNAKKIYSMIDHLREYTKLEQATSHGENINIGKYFKKICEKISKNTAKNIHFKVHDEDALVTYADNNQIKTFLSIMISNAVQFNDNTPVKIEMGLKLNNTKEDNPATNIFYIKDNGIGISQKHSQNIYAMFIRLHSASCYDGGDGMGLAYANKIIEKHNGKIWFQSLQKDTTPNTKNDNLHDMFPDDTGTIFYFSLPKTN